MAFEFAPISARIQRIREKRSIFTSGVGMSINAERTRIYTDYYKAHENEYPLLKRAGALLTFGFYRISAYRQFGGITGDTAGWFLQLCELVSLAAAGRIPAPVPNARPTNTGTTAPSPR